MAETKRYHAFISFHELIGSVAILSNRIGQRSIRQANCLPGAKTGSSAQVDGSSVVGDCVATAIYKRDGNFCDSTHIRTAAVGNAECTPCDDKIRIIGASRCSNISGQNIEVDCTDIDRLEIESDLPFVGRNKCVLGRTLIYTVRGQCPISIRWVSGLAPVTTCPVVGTETDNTGVASDDVAICVDYANGNFVCGTDSACAIMDYTEVASADCVVIFDYRIKVITCHSKRVGVSRSTEAQSNLAVISSREGIGGYTIVSCTIAESTQASHIGPVTAT